MLGDGFEKEIDSAIAIVLSRIVYNLAEVVGDQREVFRRPPDINTAGLKVFVLAGNPDLVRARPPKNSGEVGRPVPRTMKDH
jgi:hypothetical protein